MSPTSLLILLSFGFWPLVQQRGLGYWWLIVPWLLVPLLAPLIPRSGSVGRTRLPRWWVGIVGGALSAAMFGTPAACWLLSGRPRPLDRSVTDDSPWRVGLELTAPADAAGRYLPDLRETIRTAYPDGKYRGAILGGLAQGDFLAWILDGDNSQPVMLYTRPETLEPLHWAESMGALAGGSDWWEALGRHQVNLVVIDPGKWEKLADRLRKSQAWRTVQDGGPGGLLVAVRREPKLPAELIP
jgi:hypothetical protein